VAGPFAVKGAVVLAIVNQPCGHPILAAGDQALTGRVQRQFEVLRDVALQPQCVLREIDEADCYRPPSCVACEETLTAYAAAAGRMAVLAEAEAHGVSGFASLALFDALQAGDGGRLSPLRAATVTQLLIHAEWKPTVIPEPRDLTDPRVTGR
jgi:hypothetical protein